MLPENGLGKLAEYSNDIVCTIDEEGSTFTFTIAQRDQ